MEELTATVTASSSPPDAAKRPGRRELGPDSGAPEPHNSIRPSRRRARQPGPTKETESAAFREAKSTADPGRTQPSTSGRPERFIPDHIRERFVQVGHRYYFSDGAHAFTDRGTRLVTPSENTEVVKSLIAVAEARGWQEVTVTGSERFRKEAWVAATTVGLKVRGYSPTEFERAHLVRKLARETAGSPG